MSTPLEPASPDPTKVRVININGMVGLKEAERLHQSGQWVMARLAMDILQFSRKPKAPSRPQMA
jgi:hypothetical protein